MDWISFGLTTARNRLWTSIPTEATKDARYFDYVVFAIVAIVALWLVWVILRAMGRIVVDTLARSAWLLSWTMAIAVTGVGVAIAWHYASPWILAIFDGVQGDIQESLAVRYARGLLGL